jgi:hypothetical protein
MKKYRLTAICKLCNQSWPRVIGIDEPVIQTEVVKFLGIIIKTHSCKEFTGSWQIDWGPAEE